MELQLDGIRGKSHQKKFVGNNEEYADVDNSIDTIVGKEIVLDLSLITEHVQQEDLIASTSMPSMVQVALPVEATYPETIMPEQSNFDGREISVAKKDATENIPSDVPWTKLLPPNKPNEEVDEDDAAFTRGEVESVDVEGTEAEQGGNQADFHEQRFLVEKRLNSTAAAA